MSSIIAGSFLDPAQDTPALKRQFHCRCGKPVYFRNSLCVSCDTQLGFEPGAGELLALSPGAQADTWIRWQEAPADAAAPAWRRCSNFHTAAVCNWLIPADPQAMPRDAQGRPLAERTLCPACAVNRVIPDLSGPKRAQQWGRIELAKRRLFSQLIAMGLPVASRVDQDPQRGVAFDFLADTPGAARVLTGHDEGQITLNIAEADDAQREQAREAMHEPYRTLLGHLRHEIGHYYWDRLVAGTPWLDDFRSLFGDERADYAQALQRHYQQGPAPDWPLHYISAYAASHPWEDWAETWAHYLHIVDTMATVLGFGLAVQDTELSWDAFPPASLYRPEADDAAPFLAAINDWVRLTGVLNELSRSMGVPDFYPFVMSLDVVRKLQFVHLVVKQAREGGGGEATLSG
ncbi:MAG: putative zinc-binding metallopeptidase [Pseudoxanthomonas sp.]